MNAISTLTQYTQHPKVFSRYLNIVQREHVARMYISECLLAVANSKELQACTPQSIITASLKAVTLGLHLDLDQAYLVPFKDQCTMITGYKGMRDMAIRTQKYRILHANHIPAGFTVKLHPITGQAEHVREPQAAPGVVAYFEMFNSFSKTVYMTLNEIHEHAAQYSKSYTFKNSPWKATERSREMMERKTVFRRLMLEWGYMSPEERAIIDQEENPTIDGTLPPVEEISQIEITKEVRTQSTVLSEMGF